MYSFFHKLPGSREIADIHSIVRVRRAENKSAAENQVEQSILHTPVRQLSLKISGGEYDRISRITYEGVRSTHDIEVEGTHTYTLANGCMSLNCQDILADLIPVIAETMSASRKYGFYQFTGTPKTTDNTLNVLFEQSSMAEWVIPCPRCKKLNVPSIRHDLLNMIGKKTVVCAKKRCGRPLDVRLGWYEHEFPERRSIFAGYHISQIIHPLHCTDPEKWAELLYKMNHYSKFRFMNEILGEPCDESVKLITVGDLRAASNNIVNTVEGAMRHRDQYESVVMGIDWSGGGSTELSTTVVAVVGIRIGSDQVDCIYTERLPTSMQPQDEIKLLLEYASIFNVTYIAHDYGGAGALREIIMDQSGMNPSSCVPFSYVYAVHKDIITYNKPSGGIRQSWSIDKSRSLVVLTNMIKAKKVTLPEFGSSKDITCDLLALAEESRETPRGQFLYLITRSANQSDDFAHALNFACSAIWHTRGTYPSVVEAERYKVDADMKNIINPAEVNWHL
jgi:hypothetical protein